MNLIRPIVAQCKDCHQLPTLTESMLGLTKQYQFICDKCEYKTGTDSSPVALTILWNLYNTGAVDINLSPIQ